MDANIYYKQKKTDTLIPILFSLIFGFLFIFFLSNIDMVVFAQQEKYLSDSQFKNISFIPNLNTSNTPSGLKLLTIVKDDTVYRIITKSSDIFQIFRENDILLDEKDVVTLSTQYIQNGTIITVVRTDKITVFKFIDVAYRTEIVENGAYLKGQKHIKQKGVNGVMKQKLLNTYENGYLVESILISEEIDIQPVNEIIELGTSDFLLKDIEKRDYDCPFWYSVVDSGPYSEEEKKWLKFIMYCESGCNAESDKGTYKGLFQWSPYWWKKQFKENIFDGYAQIKHTIEKYRAGESTRRNQWPACHSRYLENN